MAIYRTVHTTFWTDPFVESLNKDQKLFYLYILTNSKVHLSGIYEITKKLMAYETGFTLVEIQSLIKFFSDNNKMYYSEETNEVAISNWAKYNVNGSPQQSTAIYKSVSKVKDALCIEHVYGIDSPYMQALPVPVPVPVPSAVPKTVTIPIAVPASDKKYSDNYLIK
jgi:hypothetical protein